MPRALYLSRAGYRVAMLTFYLIAGGLAVLAAAVLARPLIAGRATAESRDAHDAQVFRDQLAEIERDLARGTIAAAEAEGARVEVARRLIAADARARRAAAPVPAPPGRSRVVAVLAMIGIPALAGAIYLGVGAPGMPDQPLAERSGFVGLAGGPAGEQPSQEEAEAQMAGEPRAAPEVDQEYADLVARLEQTVAGRPDDVEGHRLLANALMQLGRYGEAWRTYDRVIALSGGSAGAEVHAAKAEGMVMAAGGYASPEAIEEIARALELDPALPMARYYAGLALRQAGRTGDAIAMWEDLRRDSAPDAPYLDWLDMMLAEARQDRVPSPGPGPAEIEAAEQLSPEERAAMIEGMVSRLESRLTSEGGTVEEWIRLMRAFVELDRPADAERTYRLAAAALADDGSAGFLKEQAMLLGVAVE